MKCAPVLVALVAAIALCGAIPTYQQGVYRANVPVQHSGKVTDKDTPLKQKLVLQLLERVHQPTMHQEIIKLAKSWNPEQLIDHYANQWVVKNFVSLYKQGTLPRGEYFQVHEEQQLKEAIALFDMFYFAKDFDTFVKTAAWARDHVNEGQYVYAVCVAVLHRDDCQDVVLPALYELNPHVYFSASDIYEFASAKMQGQYNYIKVTNWTTANDIINTHDLVGYFTEDIGLNAYNAYTHLTQPFWLSSEKYGLDIKKYRGEAVQYINHQILAHYNLHRMANRLPELHDFDWEQPIEYGYNPDIKTHTGKAIPARPDNMELSSIHAYSVQDVKNIENRIKDAIDSGYVIGKDGNQISIKGYIQGINILGNIIDGNEDSVNSRYYQSYTSMLHNLVALIVDPTNEHGVAPGVLASPNTALKDPAFYYLQKHISGLVKQYKENLPAYRTEELYYPGVSIKDVAVDKLVTYFDLFDVDVTRAVSVASQDEAEKIHYVARDLRLNHKPFTYKIKVASDKKTSAVVRVFLGPNTDFVHSNFYGDASDVYTGHETHDINRLKDNFVELDRFPVTLKQGENLIERHSREFTSTVGDIESYNSLLKTAESGKYYASEEVNQCGFPDRLVLPKGHKAGLPLTLYVAVSPAGDDTTTYYHHETGVYGDHEHDHVHCNGLTVKVDNRPLGYPFDRHIKNFHAFYTPNMYFKDVIVYHKDTTSTHNHGPDVFVTKNVNDFDHLPKYSAAQHQNVEQDDTDAVHYDDMHIAK